MNGFNRPFARGSMPLSPEFSQTMAICEDGREVSILPTDQGEAFDEIA